MMLISEKKCTDTFPAPKWCYGGTAALLWPWPTACNWSTCNLSTDCVECVCNLRIVQIELAQSAHCADCMCSLQILWYIYSDNMTHMICMFRLMLQQQATHSVHLDITSLIHFTFALQTMQLLLAVLITWNDTINLPLHYLFNSSTQIKQLHLFAFSDFSQCMAL